MKKRKFIVVAFILVAALTIGIGYAALTNVLDINGKADVNASAAEEAFNEDIYFSAAVANGENTTNTASINANNKDSASFTANSLKGKDDTATFTFTIKNDGDIDATVTPKLTTNTLPEYFELTSDWNGEDKTLVAGGKLDITVTVKLLKTPTETISGSFLVELTAVSVDTVDTAA
ncbi:MAG: hypothetical protein IJY08_00510 [Clostridia bacterium]|nr:hypothetical protein [Clostridia bacterium]